jgi:hypothetical protein
MLTLAGCAESDSTSKQVAESKPSVAAQDISVSGPPILRRLTQVQYANIVTDVFGPNVRAGGRFEPDLRYESLIAIGTSQASITASGFEQYDTAARSVAAQVLGNKELRNAVMPCTPQSETAADDKCAATFLSDVGHYFYRRPVTAAELQPLVKMASEAAKATGDFYAGLQTGLSVMMVSPQFLFRQERAEPAPGGGTRLDASSKASRLSFFLWNTTPDAELLRAAEAGELHTQKGIEKQVDRMLASPKVRQGVRAFFTDFLELDKFETLSKDSQIYPEYTSEVAHDAQEQTLRTVVDLLLTQNGDYRELFSTRKTYLSPVLAAVYGVPAPSLYNSRDGWTPYEFPESAGHAGILTQISFGALHSHPGRTSPTLRGKALREVLMCQRVPAPPGNVSFNVVQDTTNPTYKTVRQRLQAHAGEAMCIGCHKLTDPMGLSLEQFNTVGGFRSNENGAPIDTSGELDGKKFTDAAGLGVVLRDNKAITSCLVDRYYSFAIGRKPTKPEAAWLNAYLKPKFESLGYRVPQLLRTIATSSAFLTVTPSSNEPPAAEEKKAEGSPSSPSVKEKQS